MLHWDQTQVNYGPRTWWIYNMHAAGPVQGPEPSGAVGGDYDGPAQVKQWLDQGVGKIVGHPYVDGHHTVELSISAGPVKAYVIFADVHTYQVVRTIDYFNQLPQSPPITANYHVGAEDPGHGEAGQQPRDPGRLHPRSPSATSSRHPLARTGRGARERRRRHLQRDSFCRA